MEWLVLGLFCLDLLVCILLGLSTLTALVIGLFLFIGYGLYKGHRLPALFAMMWDGVRTVKSILVVFLIIGILTATWRAAGTIPAIIYYTLPLIRPSVFVPLVFLLNSLVSFLIGTSFGTAATMGVICMTMGLTMGADPVLLGGAILSGVFYGDRCSPVSTSAMLVAQLTGTDLYDNLRRMFGTAALPTALSVILYYFLGRSGAGAVDDNVRTLFAEHFHLSVLTLLPAAAILVLALCRVKVRQAMLISIALAVCCCLFLQKIAPAELLRIAVFGFQPEEAELSRLLAGGGILSMVRTIVIVGLSSSYAGLFRGTGLLHGLQEGIQKAAVRVTPFGATLLTAVLTSMVSCNQTLAIILTNELCRDMAPSPTILAQDLENTVVVLAALVPWSIACQVPLSSVGAPTIAAAAAFYLYLLPLTQLIFPYGKAERRRVPYAPR